MHTSAGECVREIVTFPGPSRWQVLRSVFYLEEEGNRTTRRMEDKNDSIASRRDIGTHKASHYQGTLL
jgi:hypothetical protein